MEGRDSVEFIARDHSIEHPLFKPHPEGNSHENNIDLWSSRRAQSRHRIHGSRGMTPHPYGPSESRSHE